MNASKESKEKLLIFFKNQFIQFLDELIAQFPNEADLVIVRIFFKDQIPIREVITYAIKELLPFENEINNHDDRFFLKNDDLFTGLSGNKVIHFKRLWQSDQIDSEDRDVIWAWFESFVKIAKKYQRLLSER